MSAVNDANIAPSFAFTTEPVEASLTSTLMLPFVRTPSPAEISAAALSSISYSLAPV